MRTSLELDQALPPILVDHVQIQQVVLNLVRNAVEAMEQVERRALTVGTRSVPERGMAEIIVADTGPGIAPELADRLFQPFVTNNPPVWAWAYRSAGKSSKRIMSADDGSRACGRRVVSRHPANRRPRGDGRRLVSDASISSMTTRPCAIPFRSCSTPKAMR